MFRLAALTILGVLLCIPAAAAADGFPRHPDPGAVRAPAGVPSSYVFTHHGWFHPSCVVRIGEDEVVGADTVAAAPTVPRTFPRRWVQLVVTFNPTPIIVPPTL